MSPVFLVLTALLHCDADMMLGRLARQVVEQHFTDCRCLAVVTEDTSDIVDHIAPLELPFYHVQLSLRELMTSQRLSK